MKKAARIFIAIIGLLIGFIVGTGLHSLFLSINIDMNLPGWVSLLAFCALAIIFGIIFYFLAPSVIENTRKLIAKIENKLSKLSISEITMGILGLIIGLVISFLLTGLINNIPSSIIRIAVTILIYFTCTILSINIAVKRQNEMNFSWLPKKESSIRTKHSGSMPLILDTSIIIDGRIYDICKTGIIEATLIIPNFVLVELRHIADSSDDLKRSRGRRGLDILNMIQKDLPLTVEIDETDFDDTLEVDSKLLKLASLIGGKIATNDYNLNKVAAVQGIQIININDLANAVKPIALPGEKMNVTIIKKGKESSQGIAYFDDGTMIVVDGANDKIDQSMDVMVTSVLQTSAGRMIFAKLIKS